MTMKKLLPILLAVLLLTGLLCACGNNSDKDDVKPTITTQPVGDATGDPTNTKVYYKTDAAGSTITTVIVLPEEGEPFPIETAAPTDATTTTAPTFAVEEDDPFNDAELNWD